MNPSVLSSLTSKAMLSAAFLLFVACSDKPAPDVVDSFSFAEGDGRPSVEPVVVARPAALVGKCANLTDAMRNRFSKITEVDNARIILIDNQDVEQFSEDLYNYYQRGQLIIVLKPDGSTLTDWATDHNVSQAFDTDQSTAGNPCEIYGFNNTGRYFFLDNFKQAAIDDDDVPLNVFTTWVNRVTNNVMSNNPTSYDIQRRFRPQEVCHTFPVALTTDQLEEKGWHFGDALSKHATIDVTYKIYPIYAFPGSEITGDIYVVDAEMTVHSDLIYNGSWSYKVNGDVKRHTGFYLTNCRFTASIDDAAKFAVSPEPTLTTDGKTYNGGIDFSFNGTIVGGANDKLNYRRLDSGTWTWKNVNERDLPGVTIVNLSDAGRVAFDCNIGGLPVSNKSYTVGLPSVATDEMKFCTTWVWNIATPENSDRHHFVTIDVAPTYAGYTLGSLANSLNVTEFTPVTNGTKDSSFRFRLVSPERSKP